MADDNRDRTFASDDRRELQSLAQDLIVNGIRRIHVLGWRDLDDSDSGGSEIHADNFMRRWQEVGLDVLHRTSRAAGVSESDVRHGYRVIRRGSRLGVFPRTIGAEIVRSMGPYDAVVEIWNGMPWMTPVWCRKPRLVILHHVHDRMWSQTFPRPVSWIGRELETSWAPRFYRRSETVTLCEDSRLDLLRLGWPSERVHVAPAGVDPFFSPGGERTPHPSVVAVGRLAPVKRFVDLLDQMNLARQAVPALQLTIVGEGPMRPALESWIHRNDARQWVHLPGRVAIDRLRQLYRESWIITSASLAEGWGLTLTEAAGCGTPAVATDIGGHRAAVRDGRTGTLVELDRLGEACGHLLADDLERGRMAQEAILWAQSLSWDALAVNVLRPLRDEVLRRR